MAQLTSEQQLLVTEHARVVQIVTRHYARKYEGLLTRDEVHQSAQLALIAAAQRFDPSRGVPFGGFAWKRVEGAVTRAAGVEKRTQQLRNAMNRYMSLATRQGSVLTDTPESASSEWFDNGQCAVVAMMLGMFADAASAQPDALLMRRERMAAMRRGIDQLDPGKRTLIERHYFLDKTLTEIAGFLGWTFITTRRRHREALQFLAEHLAGHGEAATAGVVHGTAG